ncbi:hypothetical protein CCACVL1_28487 [Corchorus capsularis]|uniref:Uncharacterized protein n=1 Tax=Corchorus capsularis TaxID=210143 RepID=A0A1R3G6C5_COCAP|nr:hypothetical protein CCACVL1_28487 [Corchorus capsularis]
MEDIRCRRTARKMMMTRGGVFLKLEKKWEKWCCKTKTDSGLTRTVPSSNITA